MDKVLKLLSSFLNIKEETLKTAIEKDEVENIKFDGLKIYKDSEIEEIKTNFKKLGGDEKQKTLVADVAKSAKLEGEFTSLDKVFSTIKTNAVKDAKIDPDKKVSEIKKQLETAQKTISEKENAISGLNQKLENTKVDALIFGKLPNELPGGITRNEAATILKMGAQTVFENGKFYPLIDGEKPLDEKGKHIDFETFIDSKINERGWKNPQPNPGGKGSGHSGSGGETLSNTSDIKSMSDYEKYVEQKGINPNGSEAAAILEESMKNKDFKVSE